MGQEYQVVASLNDREAARAKADAPGFSFQIPKPKLWSPDSPTLYDLEIRLSNGVVRSCVGIREVGRVTDANGHWGFMLNGKPIFHWRPLDQGW